MTNEEALHCIKTTDYCYVVWSIEKNVVIAVYPVPRDATIEQGSAALSKVDSEHAGPTKGRFLDPRTTTLTTLSEEQQQTETIHDRERTFRSWQAYSTNDLLGILEHGEFPPPMDPFYGAQHIIEQLYYSPRRALSSEQLGRLDAMAASSCASLEPAVALRLECWLAVLHRDRDRLERFWSRWIGTVKLAASDAFATATGDLQLDSGPVIDSFMEVVRSSGMFGPRFDAMVALGKIGSSAGETAAATIAAHIYQSSQQVAAVCDLSIERIRSSASDWGPVGCVSVEWYL